MFSVSPMPTSRLIRSLLALLFGVCPLLFFTDLTRNPYYTQIALFNILIPLSWLVWLSEAWEPKRCLGEFAPSDPALLALAGVSSLSWILSMRGASGVSYSHLQRRQ